MSNPVIRMRHTPNIQLDFDNHIFNLLEQILNLAGYNPITFVSDLAKHLDISQKDLFNKPNKLQKQKLHKLYVLLITKQYPIEYILKYTYFYGAKLIVEPPLYIPNPFTENLVTKILNWQNTQPPTPYSILDIGTGTGAIIIALAKNLSNQNQFIGTDINPLAVRIAKKNAKLNNARVKIIRANVTKILPKNHFILPKHRNVIVVTNKPYLPQASYKTLPKSVRYQDKKALLTSKNFNKNLKQYIQFLLKHNYNINLFMETLRTRNPLSAKIVHYSFTNS